MWNVSEINMPLLLKGGDLIYAPNVLVNQPLMSNRFSLSLRSCENEWSYYGLLKYMRTSETKKQNCERKKEKGEVYSKSWTKPTHKHTFIWSSL